MIHRPAELQRPVKQIGLGEGQRLVALVLADLELHGQALALAEQVVRGVVEADKGARQPADAAGETDAVLAFLPDLQRDVHRGILHVLLDLGVLFGLQRLEVLQLVQAQQAQLPQIAVVNLAFFQRQFAADDLVAGGGVALELDAANEELLAFIEIDSQA